MSPQSHFDHWSAVSHTGSSSGHVIALDQSEASICAQRAHFTTVGWTHEFLAGVFLTEDALTPFQGRVAFIT